MSREWVTPTGEALSESGGRSWTTPGGTLVFEPLSGGAGSASGPIGTVTISAPTAIATGAA